MQVTDSDLRELRDLILGMDKKLDVFIARTDERFNSIDERFKGVDERFKGVDERFKGIENQLTDIKVQLRAQDTRLWGFITTLSLTIIGFLTKLAFFSGARV
jgi:archaellum component FlaC